LKGNQKKLTFFLEVKKVEKRLLIRDKGEGKGKGKKISGKGGKTVFCINASCDRHGLLRVAVGDHGCAM
jgi:hypothetical protein